MILSNSIWLFILSVAVFFFIGMHFITKDYLKNLININAKHNKEINEILRNHVYEATRMSINISEENRVNTNKVLNALLDDMKQLKERIEKLESNK